MQTEIGTSKANSENLKKRKEQLRQEIANNISELDGESIKKEDILKEFKKIEKQRNDANENLVSISNKRDRK